MKRWLEYMPLGAITPADRNPKGHDTEGIRASISRFGYVEAITIDERTMKLVSGHGRVADLLARFESSEAPPDGIEVGEDGQWLAPVTRGWASRSDAEAEAFILAANRLVERGGYHDDVLAAVLSDLASLPNGLDGTGYTDADLAKLVGALQPLPVPDFAPVPPESQPDLSSRAAVLCPHCGETFIPGFKAKESA